MAMTATLPHGPSPFISRMTADPHNDGSFSRPMMFLVGDSAGDNSSGADGHVNFLEPLDPLDSLDPLDPLDNLDPLDSLEMPLGDSSTDNGGTARPPQYAVSSTNPGALPAQYQAEFASPNVHYQHHHRPSFISVNPGNPIAPAQFQKFPSSPPFSHTGPPTPVFLNVTDMPSSRRQSHSLVPPPSSTPPTALSSAARHSSLPNSLQPGLHNAPKEDSFSPPPGPSSTMLVSEAGSTGSAELDSDAPRSKPKPSSRTRKAKFTEDEDELLIRLKWQERMSWRNIAKYFPGRTHGALQVRYCTKLKAKTKDWGTKDVNQLHELMAGYEREKWTVISQRMNNKYTPEQCRSKFKETLEGFQRFVLDHDEQK